MLSSIVIPLDGSDLSESALPVGSELGRALGAPVTLLTSGWGSTVEELDTYLRARAGAIEGAVTTSVVPDTFPATAISHSLDEHSAVVMFTHGRGGLGKVLLGSVAEDVVKATDRPVVLLGPATWGRQKLAGGLMLVPTDGSPTAATILPSAAEWAKALGMSVRIVAVSALDPAAAATTGSIDLAAAITDAATWLRAEGLEVEEETVEGGDPGRSIVELAGRLGAGLIAMSTHARGGIAATALGSTALTVVHDASCPVLVQKPGI